MELQSENLDANSNQQSKDCKNRNQMPCMTTNPK
jgi:hypothetical protein